MVVVSIGFFRASFRAVLGMKCASITSNFAGIPDDVRIRDRHSEGERASPRQNPIELFTCHSRQLLCYFEAKTYTFWRAVCDRVLHYRQVVHIMVVLIGATP